MLHNTGPYGPNEAPINMGAPVNMTPMSSHVNLPHNINNLNKVAHQGVPAPSGHYNLPDYPHYSHSPLSVQPQMGQFPNYQHLGFQHTNVNQNANMNDLGYPNGMFPMNLNIQNDYSASMMNYAYEKRLESRQDSYKEPNVRKMPLNIPQIPNKSYNKDIRGNYDYINDNLYDNANHNLDLSKKTQEKLQTDNAREKNICKDLSSNNDYINDALYDNANHNLDLSKKTQEKLPIDSIRRKNIENTVKLIENILIHSSNKPKDASSSDTPSSTDANTTDKPTDIPSIAKIDIPSDITIDKTMKIFPRIAESHTDPLELTSTDLKKDYSDNDNDKRITNNKKSILESLLKKDSESLSDDEVKPVGIMQHLVKDSEVTTDNSIVIKVENASWADSECFTPFLKDFHGFEREEHMNYRIIEGEYSVAEAVNAYKSDIKPEGVFECPHCALLFKHPKRFIIHNKWHTFGLTNVKRMEIARVREQQRYERKEAKIIERMNSKEVTDIKVDGKVFPCKDCDKVFSAKGSLKNHRQRSHPDRIRECRICHKTLLNWSDHRAHMATHSADSGPGFQCNQCPKRFKYAHSLAKHSDTHLEKIHACAECPKKFGSQALLKMHMKTHERVLRGATFRCTYCGKGFFESYCLQVHERTHRNERPFTCEICNTSYGTNSSLKRHVKVSHNKEKPHQCNICHRNFSTESIRDRHELRLHGKPEDFKFPCKLCSCKYLRLKDLQKHIYKMHPKGKKRKREDKEDKEEDVSDSE